jgi:hypothetical protein
MYDKPIPMEHNWTENLNIAITVCNTEADIIYMNAKSRATFAKYGENLLNQSLYNCHGEASSEKIRQMLSDGSENIYTIEKAGVKKIIVQMPWKQDELIAGLVELSIELPKDMAHFVRK